MFFVCVVRVSLLVIVAPLPPFLSGLGLGAPTTLRAWHAGRGPLRKTVDLWTKSSHSVAVSLSEFYWGHKRAASECGYVGLQPHARARDRLGRGRVINHVGVIKVDQKSVRLLSTVTTNNAISLYSVWFEAYLHCSNSENECRSKALTYDDSSNGMRARPPDWPTAKCTLLPACIPCIPFPWVSMAAFHAYHSDPHALRAVAVSHASAYHAWHCSESPTHMPCVPLPPVVRSIKADVKCTSSSLSLRRS